MKRNEKAAWRHPVEKTLRNETWRENSKIAGNKGEMSAAKAEKRRLEENKRQAYIARRVEKTAAAATARQHAYLASSASCKALCAKA